MNTKAAVNTDNALQAAAAAGVASTGAEVAEKNEVPSAAPAATKVASVDGKVVKVKASEAAPALSSPTETEEHKAKVVKTNAKAVKKDAKKEAAKGSETKKDAKKENPKQVAARKIFEKMTKGDKKPSAGEVAGAIMKDLKITYSNAYYYVTRVFGMESAKTAKK